MNKTIAILGIVGAFALGTMFSADIATAVKPVTEVLVTNTNPIPVTGIVSSPTQTTGLAIVLLGTSQTLTCSGGSPITLRGATYFYDDGDPASQEFLLERSGDGADFITRIISASITSTEFTLDTLTIRDQICPGAGVGVGVITGSCGNSKTVTYTDDDGRTLSLLADVACVSP